LAVSIVVFLNDFLTKTCIPLDHSGLSETHLSFQYEVVYDGNIWILFHMVFIISGPLVHFSVSGKRFPT